MNRIPAGRFRMGSHDFYPEEAPVREIELSPFAIQRRPVTVAAGDVSVLAVARLAGDPR